MTPVPPFATWIRTNVWGWCLGVLLVILFSVGGEAVGLSGSQAPVGAGMGLGVGLLQERRLRAWLGRPNSWRMMTLLGLLLPFLLSDLLSVFRAGAPYRLYATVAVAGLAVGFAQARVLRPFGISTTGWVVASLLGWTLGGFAAAAADTLVRAAGIRGLSGALLYLAVVASGGLAIGLPTGLVLKTHAKPPASRASSTS